MPGRRECRVATSCLDPFMTNEPVSIVAGGVILAGDEGKGVKRGCVYMPTLWYFSKHPVLPARYIFMPYPIR